MSTRSISIERIFPTSPEQLFKLLITPSAICQWWGAHQAIVIPKIDGIWVATWGESADQPDYVSAATIADFESPKRLVLQDYRYHTPSESLPFNADFTTTFEIDTHNEGAILRITQDGFPMQKEANEFYHACQQGWQETLDGMQRYLVG
jgi:uncharacterized protein YndB with AHSA1/START domain